MTLNCKTLIKKVASNKTKHLLVENEFKKLQKFDLSYFTGRHYFVGDDGTQNYLVFQPVNKYFKKVGNTKTISEWKSKGLSDETIIPCDENTSSNSRIYQ